MGEVSTIGLDIAKSVFQVHGVDRDGAVVIRKRVSRAKVLEFFADLPSCLIGIEACPSAHHWGRQLQALGHTVRLMPPSYVKAYLKRSKNDANDAAAICEAVTRPSMRFRTHQIRTATIRLDAASQSAASGPSANDAVERDPRAYGRARPDRRQRPQWHGRVAQDHCRTRRTTGFLQAARFSLDVLARQYKPSRQRSAPSRSTSMPGTDHAKKAGGWRKSPESVRSSPPPWSPRWAIGRHSRPDATWRPGSGLFPSSIRPAARNGLAASQSKAIDICDGCLSRGPWPSSDTHVSAARSGCGWPVSWIAGQSRLLPSRWPTRSHAWPGR